MKARITRQNAILLLKNIRIVFQILRQSGAKCVVPLITFNIVQGAFIPINIYIWKMFLDSVSEAILGGDIREPFIWITGVCLVRVFSGFVDRLCMYFQRKQADYLGKYISNLVVDKVAELDMCQFDAPKTFDTLIRVSGESSSRCVSILSMIVNLVRSIAILVGTFSLIMTFSPLFAFLCFLFAVPLFCITTSISLQQYSIFLSRVQKYRHIMYMVNLFTRYENIKELKLFRASKYIKSKMNLEYDRFLNEDKKIRKNNVQKLTITDGVQKISSFGLKAYVLFNVITKKGTIGDLTMYISAIDNLESAISTVLDSISSLFNDNLYLEALVTLLNTSNPNEQNEKLEFPKDFREIEFKNVSFRYPGSDNYCLYDVNLKIERNKAYALVGRNGSGKTTLVKLMARIYEPTQGEILVDGINLNCFSRDSIHTNIGIIFQDFIKYPLTVAENIGIGNVDSIDDIDAITTAAKHAGADSFVQELTEGYNSMLQKEWDNAVELSIGQWQKVAISRAFVNKDASILVLDEPSASLDAESECEVFTSFKKIMLNKTSILITHRFSNVKMVEEIFVLSEGRIIEQGSHDSLMRENSMYRDLYSMQAKGYAE